MNPQTIPQGSLVTPKTILKIGRMTAHPGQIFWVTCSTLANCRRDGVIKLARSGQNTGSAKAYSFADFLTHFTPVSTFQ